MKIKTKDLVLLAMLCALHSVIGFFRINLSIGRNIFLTFIVKMIAGCMYPVWIMLPFGFALDTVGVLLRSSAYIPAYALNEILACVLYSFFLFKKEVKIKDMILSKLSVSMICNVLMNSFLTFIYFNTKKRGLDFFLISGLAKNLILLPFEVAIFYTIYRYLKPLINKYRYTK